MYIEVVEGLCATAENMEITFLTITERQFEATVLDQYRLSYCT